VAEVESYSWFFLKEEPRLQSVFAENI